MYFRTIKFQRTENGEWSKGYYVGAGENSDNSCILDSNYQPVTGYLWNYVNDYCNNLEINIPDFTE